MTITLLDSIKEIIIGFVKLKGGYSYKDINYKVFIIDSFSIWTLFVTINIFYLKNQHTRKKIFKAHCSNDDDNLQEKL